MGVNREYLEELIYRPYIIVGGDICGFHGEYRWLSNFSPCVIVHEGRSYPSVENAYQASKYPVNKRSVFSNIYAGEAKRLGRKAHLTAAWDRERLVVMKTLLDMKFRAPRYKQLLLDTGNLGIYEFNNWDDTFWGVCDRKGANVLGKMISDIRQEIREEQNGQGS